MNKFGIFASTMMFAIAPIAVGCAQVHLKAQSPSTESCIKIDEGEAVDGMFFSTENVVMHYECDIDTPEGGALIGGMVYDSADANLENVEILVCWETYGEIETYITDGIEVCGHLQQVYSLTDGTPVFKLNYDFE